MHNKCMGLCGNLALNSSPVAIFVGLILNKIIQTKTAFPSPPFELMLRELERAKIRFLVINQSDTRVLDF